jgi:hypothetical protein
MTNAHRDGYYTRLFSLLDEDARGLLTNWIDGNVVRLKPDPQS